MNAHKADAMLASGDNQGYAAVAIIKVVKNGEEMSFAMQRKTPGYPAERMVGALCLFGGRGRLPNHEKLLRSSFYKYILRLGTSSEASECVNIECTL
jgi:hypothetical protein